MFKISNDIRRLSENEKLQYKNDGYITGLPVFANEAREDLNKFFVSLSSRLSSNIDINQTNMWHKASLKFYNLCRTPAILDYVEDLLGPHFETQLARVKDQFKHNPVAVTPRGEGTPIKKFQYSKEFINQW